MTVNITRGDLLRADAEAIVNTVNCVGVMGKGIALQFKHKWPDNFKAYQQACTREQVKPGRMFVYDSGGLVKPHFIINFPTKQHWRGKSRIEDIAQGLADLTTQIGRLNIQSVAIPPLGCGNGGLDWDEVRERIVRAFDHLPHVTVLLFEPKGAPSPQDMVIRTKRPKMTEARAAIIEIIAIYRKMQYALSRIEVQKLVYLLEEAGQPLNLAFGKNKYGPYSDKLRHVLEIMDGHYIRGVGDHVGEAEIVVLPEALDEAEYFLGSGGESEVRDRVDRVARLIDGFETPYGMELLATVHWVTNRPPHARNPQEAVTAFQEWNERKRLIFKEAHIALAWQRLSDGGWLPSP